MNELDIKFFGKYLDSLFPDAKAELDFNNNFELLIAVVLSAQTTDIAVNKVTPNIFKTYPGPKELMHADLKDVESLLRTIGLFRTKAKNIVNLSKIIVDEFNGEVPNTREGLESLPGVGRKTANVVLSVAFDIPAFAVDTHVMRVSKRLGLAEEKDNAYQVEMKLTKLFEPKEWKKRHHQLILYGRYHCKARNPECGSCQLKEFSNYNE